MKISTRKNTCRILSALLASAMLITSAPQSLLTARAAADLPPAVDTADSDSTGDAAKQAGEAGETAPADALPENPDSEDAAPKDGPSEESAPEGTVPGETKSEETAPDEAAPEETPPEGTISEDTISEENAPEDTTPEEALPEESVPGETVSDNTLEDTGYAPDRELSAREDRQVFVSGSGADGSLVTWVLYQDGELVVEGTGEFLVKNRDTWESLAPWCDYGDKILSATVHLKDTTDAHGMFQGCTALKTVNLKEFDTSKVTDMRYMFDRCSSLTDIDVSGFDTSQATNISDMFQNCSSLTKLDLSKFDTSNVTDMSNMFAYCSQLREVNVSSFDTSKTLGFGGMFSHCTSLETLDLTNFVIKKRTGSDWDICGGMLEECTSLRKFTVPREVYPYYSIYLPKTDGSRSWRKPDGTRVSDWIWDSVDAQPEFLGVTLSTDTHVGVRFEGTNFKLEEYPDVENIQNAEQIFPVGAKESFTFTVLTDPGYTVTPAVLPKLGSTKITVTLGESPDRNTYRYTVTLKNPEEGYIQDETITIQTAKPATNELNIEIEDNKVIADYFVVADGKKLADHMAVALSVDNEHDITIYAKPADESGHAVPRLKLLDSYNGWIDTYDYIESAETLTETEKEFAKGGYYVLRLGRVYERTHVSIVTRWVYNAKIITEGFPEGVQIFQYTLNEDFKKYEARICGEEIYAESGKELYLQPRWSDPQNAHKWCQLELKIQRQDDTVITFPSRLGSVTVPGIEGEVWPVQLYDDVDIVFALAPHEIQLDYVDGDLADLALSGGNAQLTENGHMVRVHSGDSLSLGFAIDEALTIKGITVYEGGETIALSPGREEETGRYTITLGDLPSRIHKISRIHINTEDVNHRPSLSNPQNTVTVSPFFTKLKPSTYRNEPIVASKVLVSISYMEEINGKAVYRSTGLDSGKDYTLTYSNNINAGDKAAITITANPASTRCRGQYVHYFTIDKAKSFSIPDAHFNVEADSPQTDLLEDLVIRGTYDQDARPTEYRLTACSKGGILEDEPTINGNTITYRIRPDADMKSAAAKFTLQVSFENYHDSQVKCELQLVERAVLVLGGTLTADKVYDGAAYVPDFGGLQIISKDGAAPGEEETARILSSIKSSMSYHYTGTRADGTAYDSDIPPVDVGNYKLQAKVAKENTFYKSDWAEVGAFQITRRDVRFTADDITLYVNDTVPAQNEYSYRVEGLADGDAVADGRKPVLSCAVKAEDMAAAGTYPIQAAVADAANKPLIQITNPSREDLKDRDVTANYNISGVPGTLHIEEAKKGSYTVTYDLSPEKGGVIRRSGIAAGSLLLRPVDPEAKGYRFLGWYLDRTLAKAWNFSTDTVEGDTTLYAGWSILPSADPDSGLQLYVQEILPQTYTGKALTPAITVYAADGETPLKKNKDYSVVYKNNTDADARKCGGQTIPHGGVGSDLSDTEGGFDSALAYAVITGKGNYAGTVYMNFHISQADLSNADDPSSGMTLKYTESFEEKSGKTAAIVTKLKTKTKTLKYGTDYTLSVKKAADNTDVNLTDKGQLPLNAGTYSLIIQGTGNYTGSLEKELYVADKEKLLKNAKITGVGKVSGVTKELLEQGITAQNLQVGIAGQNLTKDTDYTVAYTGNHAIGTATLKITGKGSYFGSKSVTFQIKGTAFKEKEFGTVALQNMTYTGAALTQNDVQLVKNGNPLDYGNDYTISYKNNVKAGKATMTFKAKPSSGYSGSFKKTFRINPLPLDSSAGDSVLLDGAEKKDGTSQWVLAKAVPYQKKGAKPSDRLKVRLAATNAVLKENTDYKVKYQNNTAVSVGTASMTLTGRGNFTGSLTVGFDIKKASLFELYQTGAVSITAKAVKAPLTYDREENLLDEDREFEPAITVKHGKQTLKAGEDFTVSYTGNARYQLENSSNRPTAAITGIGNYSGDLAEEDTPIAIPLSIYQDSLSSSTVYVVYDTDKFSYTGGQILPKIAAVYYGKPADISKAKREHEENESVLTQEKTPPDPDDPPDPDNPSPYAYGLTKLKPYTEADGGDYIISYGPNTMKGKNGKVIIQGVYSYGGNAVATFTIAPKEICK